MFNFSVVTVGLCFFTGFGLIHGVDFHRFIYLIILFLRFAFLLLFWGLEFLPLFLSLLLDTLVNPQH